MSDKPKLARSGAVNSLLQKLTHPSLRVLFALADTKPGQTAQQVARRVPEQAMAVVRHHLTWLAGMGIVAHTEQPGEHPDVLTRVYSLTPTARRWVVACVLLAREVKG